MKYDRGIMPKQLIPLFLKRPPTDCVERCFIRAGDFLRTCRLFHAAEPIGADEQPTTCDNRLEGS